MRLSVYDIDNIYIMNSKFKYKCVRDMIDIYNVH